MTEHDDELKDLFQRKNMENAFTPDEQNWKKMSSVLKNEQEDKKRFLIYLSMLLLLLGLGGTWFFVDQSENSIDTLALNPKQPGKKTPVPIANTQQPEPSQTASTPVRQGWEALKQEQVKKETQPAKKTGVSIVKANRQDHETLRHVQVKMKMQTIEKIRTPGLKKETAPLVSNISISGKQVSVEGSSNPEPSQQSENKESILPNKAAVQVNAEESVGDHDLHDITPKLSLSQSDTAFPSTGLVTNPADTIMTGALATETYTVLVEKRDTTVAIMGTVRDSVASKTYTHRIFLEAGLNYMLGWKTNNKTEASGFNPLIGLHYYRNVSRRIGLSIGLQYSTINHLSSTSHSSTATRLKFGEENDVTVISALNMYYLLMPLKLGYGFGRNDFVCIGYTMAYLLDAESKVERYGTQLDYSSIPAVSQSMGYTSGFNPYDMQITFCYRRRLYKEWYVNGEFFYGLSDIKNNVVYASDEFERSSGFKLSIGINLWKK